MPTALTAFLRGAGTVAAFALLGYVADASHLSALVSPTIATIIAALAASALAAWDHGNSPAGTVAFGRIGRKRF